MTDLNDSQVDESNLLESTDEELEATPWEVVHSRMEGIALFLHLDELDDIPVLKAVADRMYLHAHTIVMAFIMVMAVTLVR